MSGSKDFSRTALLAVAAIIVTVIVTGGCARQSLMNFSKQVVAAPGTQKSWKWYDAIQVDAIGNTQSNNDLSSYCNGQLFSPLAAADPVFGKRGCMTAPPIAKANGRWILSFPQGTDAASTVVPLFVSMTDMLTGIFSNTLGANFGVIDPGIVFGAQSSNRYTRFATFPNGDVIAIYVVQTGGNIATVYANLYTAASGTWGVARMLSAAGRATDWATDYDLAGPASVRTLGCRPAVATSGDGSSMAAWCEDTGNGGGTSRVMYARRDASGVWAAARPLIDDTAVGGYEFPRTATALTDFTNGGSPIPGLAPANVSLTFSHIPGTQNVTIPKGTLVATATRGFGVQYSLGEARLLPSATASVTTSAEAPATAVLDDYNMDTGADAHAYQITTINHLVRATALGTYTVANAKATALGLGYVTLTRTNAGAAETIQAGTTFSTSDGFVFETLLDYSFNGASAQQVLVRAINGTDFTYPSPVAVGSGSFVGTVPANVDSITFAAINNNVASISFHRTSTGTALAIPKSTLLKDPSGKVGFIVNDAVFQAGSASSDAGVNFVLLPTSTRFSLDSALGDVSLTTKLSAAGTVTFVHVAPAEPAAQTVTIPMGTTVHSTIAAVDYVTTETAILASTAFSVDVPVRAEIKKNTVSLDVAAGAINALYAPLGTINSVTNAAGTANGNGTVTFSHPSPGANDVIPSGTLVRAGAMLFATTGADQLLPSGVASIGIPVRNVSAVGDINQVDNAAASSSRIVLLTFSHPIGSQDVFIPVGTYAQTANGVPVATTASAYLPRSTASVSVYAAISVPGTLSRVMAANVNSLVTQPGDINLVTPGVVSGGSDATTFSLSYNGPEGIYTAAAITGTSTAGDRFVVDDSDNCATLRSLAAALLTAGTNVTGVTLGSLPVTLIVDPQCSGANHNFIAGYYNHALAPVFRENTGAEISPITQLNGINGTTFPSYSYLSEKPWWPAGFVDLAADANGNFALVRSAPSPVAPSFPDASASHWGAARQLVGHEFGQVYEDDGSGTWGRQWDWKRRNPIATDAPSITRVSQVPQCFDGSSNVACSIKNPKILMSSNGQGIVLFHQAQPLPKKDSSPTVPTNPNRLWFATYDIGGGFSPASILDADQRCSPDSDRNDVPVCEIQSVDMNGASGSFDPTKSGTCQAMDDAPTTNLSATHDFQPIAAAMSSSGVALIAYHKKQAGGSGTCSDYERVFVTKYDPNNGFVTYGDHGALDDGLGYTMHAAVAVTDGGRMAVVWEQYNVSEGRHVYLRKYNLTTGDFDPQYEVTPAAHRANSDSLMPSVAIDDTGEVVVTYSFGTTTSRHQYVRHYRYWY